MKSVIAAIVAGLAITQPAFANTEPAEVAWSASISGGTAALDHNGDQPFVSVSLTRAFTNGYVRLSGTKIMSRNGQGLVGVVPSTTSQIALAGGTSFGALSLDGYASFGWRKFGAEAFRRRNGQTIEISSNGKTNAVGGSLTYDVPLGEHAFLSPFISLDYSRVDTARAIALPLRGLVTQKEKQSGVTFTAGGSVQHLFGTADRHSIGLYAAFVTSSNTTAYNRGTSPIIASRLLGALDVPGTKDSWAEYGATASFAVAKPFRIDLSIVRTAGFGAAESTSGSAGLRLSF